jgi:hypothetical protein
MASKQAAWKMDIKRSLFLLASKYFFEELVFGAGLLG